MEAYLKGPFYYRVRYTRGGAWCGLRVWYGRPSDPDTGEILDRNLRWSVDFNGKLYDDPDRFILEIKPDGTPYIAGEQITEAEYEYLSQTHAWATKYDPGSPQANPRQKVDMNKLPPLKW